MLVTGRSWGEGGVPPIFIPKFKFGPCTEMMLVVTRKINWIALDAKSGETGSIVTIPRYSSAARESGFNVKVILAAEQDAVSQAIPCEGETDNHGLPSSVVAVTVNAVDEAEEMISEIGVGGGDPKSQPIFRSSRLFHRLSL